MSYFTANLTREEDEVRDELARQDAKFGEQNHPDGTGQAFTSGSGFGSAYLAAMHRRLCQAAARNGDLTWRHVLLEEVYEAINEDDLDKLGIELLQVEAVARQWRLAIRRRAAGQGGEVSTR